MEILHSWLHTEVNLKIATDIFVKESFSYYLFKICYLMVCYVAVLPRRQMEGK